MPSIARGIRFPSLNVRGLAVAALIMAVVVGLFFIPEIVQFQRRLYPGQRADVNSAQNQEQGQEQAQEQIPNAEQEPSADDLSNENLSPLEKVLVLLHSDRARSAQAPRQAQLKEEQTRLGAAVPLFTWEKLKSEGIQQAMKKTLQQTQALTQQIDKQNTSTHAALSNYIHAIEAMTSKAPVTMDADEAVNNVEKLDIQVTRSMLADNVERPYLKEWSQISLIPELKNGRAARAKQRSISSFDPKLMLRKVTVFQSGDQYGPNYSTGTSRLTISGTMLGKDITQVKIYHDGLPNPAPALAPLANQNINGKEYKVINVILGDARGIYTFEVLNKFGETYRKSYRFFERAYSFAWGRDQTYQLPFQDGLVDVRLDRYFKTEVNPFRSEKSNKEFSVFGFDEPPIILASTTPTRRVLNRSPAQPVSYNIPANPNIRSRGIAKPNYGASMFGGYYHRPWY